MSTCDKPYTDNLAYLLPPHTSGYFVDHVGFEPLLFRARELCYQLHHTAQIIKNTETTLGPAHTDYLPDAPLHFPKSY